jgi:hypothetical protein
VFRFWERIACCCRLLECCEEGAINEQRCDSASRSGFS